MCEVWSVNREGLVTSHTRSGKSCVRSGQSAPKVDFNTLCQVSQPMGFGKSTMRSGKSTHELCEVNDEVR